jgi:hypothetical protein
MDFLRKGSLDVFCEIDLFASGIDEAIDFFLSKFLIDFWRKGSLDVLCETDLSASGVDEAIDFLCGKIFFMDF